MVICAHLLIPKRKSLWTCYTNSRPTVRITSIRQISTFFTLRQFGVPILMLSIPEMHASMRITGKISEENLMCLIMSANSVRSGRPNISFKLMLMVAKTSTDASSRMDGKSRSIIHLTIRYMPADRVLIVKSLTVLIIMAIQIKGSQ